MDLWSTILLFLLGLALIVKGGDWFLDGAVWIAEATGVPRFLIGATIVSLATTLPELTVSITGVLEGEVDLAVGNAVGSVTANLGLILGLSIVCIPSAVSRDHFSFKAILMAAAAGMLFLLCRGGELAFLPSLMLFMIFALYLFNNLQDAKTSMVKSREEHGGHHRIGRRQLALKLTLFALGLAGIVGGSQLLIEYGSRLALVLGVPSSIIGVTMVAVGTSLPELVTMLTAVAKREAAMSIGNIIGANIIDLTLILPVCSAVSQGRLTIGPQTTSLDLPVCVTLALIAVLPPLFRGRFYRAQGILMLAVYVGYLVVLVF